MRRPGVLLLPAAIALAACGAPRPLSNAIPAQTLAAVPVRTTIPADAVPGPGEGTPAEPLLERSLTPYIPPLPNIYLRFSDRSTASSLLVRSCVSGRCSEGLPPTFRPSNTVLQGEPIQLVMVTEPLPDSLRLELFRHPWDYESPSEPVASAVLVPDERTLAWLPRVPEGEYILTALAKRSDLEMEDLKVFDTRLRIYTPASLTATAVPTATEHRTPLPALPAYRRGLLELQFPSSDAYALDFSALGPEAMPFNPTPSPGSEADLLLPANGGFHTLEAPYGIADLGPYGGCAPGPNLDPGLVDIYTSRFLQNRVAAPEGGYLSTVNLADSQIVCRLFIVKTSEGSFAVFLPIGLYVGAFDRYQVFWIYATEGAREFVSP